MMDIRAAMEYLRQEPLWHIDMLEALRRGRGEIVYFKGRTVLIQRNEQPDFYLLTSDSADAGEAAFAGLPAPKWVVARGPGVAERMGERFRLGLSDYCSNVAYFRTERLAYDLPGLAIRPLVPEEIPAFLEHYDMEDEAGARERIAHGELFAAVLHGRLTGFMGLHSDGSMGMLEVFPEYRRLGVGRAIEKFFINFCLNKGWTPYGQVFLDNEKSFSLQQNLGMAVDRTRTLCWCCPLDD